MSDPLEVASTLDTAYRGACARLHMDEPWFAAFAVQRESHLSEYRLGIVRVADEKIVDWRHPLAAAYYEHAPGDLFESDTRREAAPRDRYVEVAGKVAYHAAVKARGQALVRVELADTDGRHVIVATDGGLALERVGDGDGGRATRGRASSRRRACRTSWR